MTKMQEHLVGFGAAVDLEEKDHDYSEIGNDLPSGTRRYNETRINKDGERYLVDPDKDGYEARKRAFLNKQGMKTTIPAWLQEKLKKFKGKGLNYWMLAAKFQDGFARREIAKRIKDAKTKEERRQILEEFHKSAEPSRKQTAVKLESMKDVRRIRQEMAKRLAQNSRH